MIGVQLATGLKLECLLGLFISFDRTLMMFSCNCTVVVLSKGTNGYKNSKFVENEIYEKSWVQVGCVRFERVKVRSSEIK